MEITRGQARRAISHGTIAAEIRSDTGTLFLPTLSHWEMQGSNGDLEYGDRLELGGSTDDMVWVALLTEKGEQIGSGSGYDLIEAVRNLAANSEDRLAIDAIGPRDG